MLKQIRMEILDNWILVISFQGSRTPGGSSKPEGELPPTPTLAHILSDKLSLFQSGGVGLIMPTTSLDFQMFLRPCILMPRPIGPPKFCLNIRDICRHKEKPMKFVFLWLALKVIPTYIPKHLNTLKISQFVNRALFLLLFIKFEKHIKTVYKYLLDITPFKGWLKNKFSCTALFTIGIWAKPIVIVNNASMNSRS